MSPQNKNLKYPPDPGQQSDTRLTTTTAEAAHLEFMFIYVVLSVSVVR